MKKTNRTRRRKGKMRPPTIGKNCKWIQYCGGMAFCGLKLKANNARDDVKYGGCPVYTDTSCNKCRGCGYEEEVGGETMVSKLERKLLLRKGLQNVRDRLDALEKMIEEGN